MIKSGININETLWITLDPGFAIYEDTLSQFGAFNT